ncbi:MAG: four helix bundle protein [Armatimonadota bacterium]|nr:four helix bundle protein [Armatimonadota bacterium]
MVKHFEELRAWQQGFEAAMKIFELSRQWPGDERYSLTDQVRRSSRSVCANIAEAWRKRRYPSHFVSKLSDADTEAAETQNWLIFAHSCGYLQTPEYDELWAAYEQIAGGLVNMMSNPDAWCGPSQS